MKEKFIFLEISDGVEVFDVFFVCLDNSYDIYVNRIVIFVGF